MKSLWLEGENFDVFPYQLDTEWIHTALVTMYAKNISEMVLKVCFFLFFFFLVLLQV